MPRLALFFAVLRRAALCVLLIIQQQLLLIVVVVVPGTIQIPGLCTCCVYSSFSFFKGLSSLCPHVLPPSAKYRTYCCSERDINKHTPLSMAITFAKAPLGITINSLFAINNHGPLSPAPFIYISQLLNSCILPCASVAGGVSSLAELSPMLSLEPHKVPPGIGQSSRYQVPLARVCTRLSLSRRWFCCPSRSSLRYSLRKLCLYYCRTERDIANVQQSTDKAITSAQIALGIIKPQIALDHGPLLSAPFSSIS